MAEDSVQELIDSLRLGEINDTDFYCRLPLLTDEELLRLAAALRALETEPHIE
ncbi:MAG: hypothetical protein HYZ57_10880 [Acidobacteria bacterium]|nr:hypothetical protein [Acidobacteriota bacterium]MBI3280334.1 hypothetical protein [Acidobacteriota bacterium]